MSDLIRGLGEKAKRSKSFILVYISNLALLVLSLIFLYEDVMANYVGYANLPTPKNDPVLIQWAFALLPITAGLVFGYLWLTDTRKQWAFLGAMFFYLIDFATTFAYKSNGYRSNFAIAFAESAIYIVISQFVLAISFGFMLENASWFIEHVTDAFGHLASGETPNRAPFRPMHTRQPTLPAPMFGVLPPNIDEDK